MMKQIHTLISKELLLEWRHKAAFAGILLYLVSSVFVCYLTFDGLIDNKTWNALFWIILLFASLNAVLKSFVQETDGRMLYYYIMVSPQTLIISKIIYNGVFMMVLSLIGLAVYFAFLGNPVQQMSLFVVNMVAGVMGLSAIMSLVSAIVSKVKNNFTLMGILSFPLVLPLLLVLIRVSHASLYAGSMAAHLGDLLVIILLTCVTFVLSVLLFPFIWKD